MYLNNELGTITGADFNSYIDDIYSLDKKAELITQTARRCDVYHVEVSTLLVKETKDCYRLQTSAGTYKLDGSLTHERRNTTDIFYCWGSRGQCYKLIIE